MIIKGNPRMISCFSSIHCRHPDKSTSAFWCLGTLSVALICEVSTSNLDASPSFIPLYGVTRLIILAARTTIISLVAYDTRLIW